jgi:hypothetical protein
VRRLCAALTLAAALASPSAASASLSWDDAGAQAPASVTFADVAASASAVVAVGRDTASTSEQPAIYRLAGGAWHVDTVGLPDGAAGRLTAVALSGAGAVAIGTWRDAAGAHSLVVSLDSAALVADTDATWTQAGPDPLPAEPLALALADDAGASSPESPAAIGVIGASDGQAYRMTDVNGAVSLAGVLAPDVGSASRIAGVAIFADGSGLATGNDASTGVPRFYSFDAQSTALSAKPAVASAVPMAGLAAVDPAHALAIDGSSYWDTDGSSWTRRTGNGDALHDVTSADASTGVVDAIAADNPSSGWGVVWHRTNGGDWAIDENVAAQVSTVAVAPDGTLWAAGGAGALEHQVEHTTSTGGGGTGGGTSGGTGGTSGGSGSGTPPPPAPTTETQTETVLIPPALDDPDFPVDDPVGAPKPPPKLKKRLVRSVVVKATRRGLVVSFTLTAPAKVALVAKRAGRVVGKTSPRKLAPGRRQLLLTYSGKLPSELKIVARPAGMSRRHGGTK